MWLGLIGPNVNAERAHEMIEQSVEPDDVYDFHLCLIQLGRRVCHAQRPRCDLCVLNDICPSARIETKQRDRSVDTKDVGGLTSIACSTL